MGCICEIGSSHVYLHERVWCGFEEVLQIITRFNYCTRPWSLTEKQFLEQSSKIIGLDLPYKYCHFIFREELLNKKLIEIVTRLKNKYKLILISNNSKEYCEEYLFKTKLDTLFDDLILSYQVGFRKPAREMYKLLIQRAGVAPSEILFVDDDVSKFPVAEELGIITLQYVKEKTDKVLMHLLKPKID